ncbi:MAG: ion transporter [Bacteroidales bacterium]|nr:ion transporter [Bacteroidales bacterium]
MSRFKEELVKLKDKQYRKDFLYNIIFESDTPEGKIFDVVLMIMIALSVIIAIFGSTFTAPWMKVTTTVLEYVFTVFFTAEYILRIYCSPNPKEYIFSFFGIVDLLAISPMYLGVLIPEIRSAIILRSLRLMRIFRVMKLFNFLTEGNILLRSIQASMKKIAVFFLFVVLLVICLGTLMFMVEGNSPGTSFNNVPNSIYWAVVTLTTVGYGDITPVTTLGKFLATTIMLLGYTVLAIPTGIISASMIKNGQKDINRRCSNCGRSDHDADSKYCKYCGTKFEDDADDFRVKDC